MCLALQYRCAFFELAGRHDVDDFHFDQVATAEFAVYGQIEERQDSMVFRQFQPDSDRLDMFRFQRSFLTDEATFVPSWTRGTNGR